MVKIVSRDGPVREGRSETGTTSESYRFGANASPWFRGTRVRVGVVNLTDQPPPLASGGFGYNPGVSQNLIAGRTWSLELARSF